MYYQGNTGTIQCSLDDDANSVDYTMSKMDELMPQALILGSMAPSDLAYL